MLASGSLAGVVTLAAVLTAPQAAAAAGPTGSAYALSVETTLLDQPLVNIDPRPSVTYPAGGSDSLATVGPDLAGLVTANALNVSSVVRGSVLTSEAGIADATVDNILSAEVISAKCVAGPNGVTGESSIADLTVLGQPIDVTVPGEIDVLGVATVRVNEQILSGGTLTVNAVHVIIGGPIGNVTSADIVLSQAKCAAGTNAPTTTPPTTTAPPTTSTTSTSTQTQPPTSTTTSPTTTSSTQGIKKASNDQDLADTGATGILPLSLGALALLAAGATAMTFARRKRS